MDGPVVADERWDRLIAEHQSARALAEAELARQAPLSELGRFVYGLFGGCVATLGVALLGMSLSKLGPAAEYREWSGEGVRFIDVAYYGVPGAFLSVLAAVSLLNASRGATRPAAIGLQTAAALLGAAVLACWITAIVIEGRVDCTGVSC